MKAGDVPKFIMQGVEQCWHCKRRDGSGVHHVNGYWYRLPYCKVCDVDMTLIYEPPCRGFEAKEGERWRMGVPTAQMIFIAKSSRTRNTHLGVTEKIFLAKTGESVTPTAYAL